MSQLLYLLVRYILPLVLLLTASTLVLVFHFVRQSQAAPFSTTVINLSQIVPWKAAAPVALSCVPALVPTPPSPPPPSSPYLPSPQLKPLPEHRALMPELCGSWMKPHQAYHALVSSNDFFIRSFLDSGTFRPPQLLVFRIDTQRTTGGISDRWPVLSTAMLVALLTKRAIFFDWPGHEAAYSHPNLPHMHNTTWQTILYRYRWYTANIDTFRSLLRNKTAPELWPTPPPYNSSDSLSVVVAGRDTLSARTHDYKLTFEFIPAAPAVVNISSVAELREIYPERIPVVLFAASYGGKGLTHYFYQNPALSSELEAMGLRRPIAHGCVANFVLGLSAEVQTMFEQFAWQLVRRDVLTVGVQMRLGDGAMKGKRGMSEQQRHDAAWYDDDSALLRYAAPFIRCALQFVAMHRETPDQPYLIFIVSDSVRLRDLLQGRFNHTLIVPSKPPFSVGHTDTGDRSIFASTSALRLSEAQRYLQVAAGEQWLLAWCDYLAVDNLAGGFGRSAVLRSLRTHRAFDARSWTQRCDTDGETLNTDKFEQYGHKY